MDEVTVNDEIASPRDVRPHLVLLGAGASRAALPAGDRNGRRVPLLAEVADQLGLHALFPGDLAAIASTDFESAYSKLYDRDRDAVRAIDDAVSAFFQQLELPEHSTLYDVLLLSLRPKDAVFTFNWDPFLFQAWRRIGRAGVRELPAIHFLHGNVAMGYCPTDHLPYPLGYLCAKCAGPVAPSRLIYPVEHKDYLDGAFIQGEWGAMRNYLEDALFLTVFGYSAPRTDVEAIDLLKAGWGDPSTRQFEETEIVERPGSDHNDLRGRWDPFVHTHHYQIHEAFSKSWIANHPRRSIEAFYSQFIEAQFIEEHRVPDPGGDLAGLIDWFQPLLDVERGGAA